MHSVCEPLNSALCVKNMLHESRIIAISGAAIIIYVMAGIFLTINLISNEFYKPRKKILYFLIIWLIPVIGMLWFKKLNNKMESEQELFNDNM